MRPVNLLPAEYRPRSGRIRGSARIVLAVLGVLLLMVAAYALTANQVNNRKTEIAQATQEKQEAEARKQALGDYTSFAKIKDTRLDSVRSLAAVRFDWERTLRELALVLPEDAWLTDMTGSLSGTDEESGASTAPAAAATPGPLNPSVKIEGCANDQDDVAVTMVRLRKLYRASDVTLGESAEQTDEGGGTSDGGTAGAAAGCPEGKFKFDVTVSFTAQGLADESGPEKSVPANLGGGS